MFEVRELGAEVTDLKKGDWVFSKGGHRNLQQEAEDRVVKLPGNLRPEVAVIARLIGVSTATLVKTAARPDDKVLITGAGPVGYLCAHQFQIAGYRVHLVDLDEDRRELARRSGIRSVTGKIPEVGEDVESRFAAAIDCSGHEDAVLDGACAVRKGGEVIIIGLPWRPHTDLTARDLLQVVFTNYLNLRSGWEWELPMQPEEFRPHSIFGGYRTAFRWLSEGRIPTEDAIEVHSPEDAQSVYSSLAENEARKLFHVFDWRRLWEDLG